MNHNTKDKRALITKMINEQEKDLLDTYHILYDSRPALTFVYNFDEKFVREYCDDPDGFWLFTSQHGVLALIEVLPDFYQPSGIFTVGRKAEALLRELNFQITYTARQSEGLLPYLQKESISKIYYFRGREYRRTIPEHCEKVGIPLFSDCVYEAVPQKIQFDISDYDSLWVFSPVSAETVLDGNYVPADFPIYAIGPVTADYLKESGFTNVRYCERPSFKNLVKEYIKAN